MPEELYIHELHKLQTRTVAQPVENIKSGATHELISGMLALCKEKQYMGLAAPEVGHAQQILVLTLHWDVREPGSWSMDPVVMIEPKITEASYEVEAGTEKAPSIPGYWATVFRHKRVSVSYVNQYGERKTINLEGYAARVFQRLYDTLQGVLFIHRAHQYHVCSMNMSAYD